MGRLFHGVACNACGSRFVALTPRTRTRFHNEHNIAAAWIVSCLCWFSYHSFSRSVVSVSRKKQWRKIRNPSKLGRTVHLPAAATIYTKLVPTMDDATNHTTAATATGINPLLFRSSDIAELFADLEPIPQDDGPDMVCCIDYPPGFTTVYDTFRAVLAAQEISPRVFGLTSLCLHHNSANYTVWHVRRTCFLTQLLPTTHETETTEEALERAKTMYRQELEYTASLGGSNPKNYQIWYHRRSLLESLLSMEQQNNSMGGELLTAWLQEELAREEFAYMDSVVRADGKNYHAWSHRQWLVLTLQQLARRTSPAPQQEQQDDGVSMWQSELDTTTSLIALDIRNNSAWNHRWFLLHHPEPTAFHNTDSSTTTTTPTAAAAVTRLDPAVLESQVQFALDQIVVDPYNESSCRFLVALLKEEARASAVDNKDHEDALENTLSFRALTTLHDEVLTTLDPTAVPVLSASVDLYELGVRSNQDKDQQQKDAAEKIHSLLTQLTLVDPIRTKYWKWRLEQHAQTTTS